MKKTYMQPCVEATQLQANSMILAGSEAGININPEAGENITGD